MTSHSVQSYLRQGSVPFKPGSLLNQTPNLIVCTDYSQDIEGEYYVVERYESDVEEEKGASGGSGRDARHQVIIRLSEGFLEEIENVSGKVGTLNL